MKKLSTTQDLVFHDMNQGSSIFKRYWKSSSLPARERYRNRPKIIFRRDKVLSRLLRIEMMASVKKIQDCSDELKYVIEAFEPLSLESGS
ncbi:hypothetical protein HGT70_03890 [Rosenbergiella collisarenosi]|uniref:DUF7301 family protein n=1 Tax=Rosenbergiella collisarenosi TaxID=1544695 RepID=UPI001BDB1187|nr:hypothetical protein [Rosenbergiella collisarenosi]MBT0720422.1 hypothetical protein [Rosenbergiella collisarenosi]